MQPMSETCQCWHIRELQKVRGEGEMMAGKHKVTPVLSNNEKMPNHRHDWLVWTITSQLKTHTNARREHKAWYSPWWKIPSVGRVCPHSIFIRDNGCLYWNLGGRMFQTNTVFLHFIWGCKAWLQRTLFTYPRRTGLGVIKQGGPLRFIFWSSINSSICGYPKNNSGALRGPKRNWGPCTFLSVGLLKLWKGTEHRNIIITITITWLFISFLRPIICLSSDWHW